MAKALSRIQDKFLVKKEPLGLGWRILLSMNVQDLDESDRSHYLGILDPVSMFDYTFRQAEVAEQADAHDSKSCSLGSVGSIPTFGTLTIYGGSCKY